MILLILLTLFAGLSTFFLATQLRSSLRKSFREKKDVVVDLLEPPLLESKAKIVFFSDSQSLERLTVDSFVSDSIIPKLNTSKVEIIVSNNYLPSIGLVKDCVGYKRVFTDYLGAIENAVSKRDVSLVRVSSISNSSTEASCFSISIEGEKTIVPKNMQVDVVLQMKRLSQGNKNVKYLSTTSTFFNHDVLIVDSSYAYIFVSNVVNNFRTISHCIHGETSILPIGTIVEDVSSRISACEEVYTSKKLWGLMNAIHLIHIDSKENLMREINLQESLEKDIDQKISANRNLLEKLKRKKEENNRYEEQLSKLEKDLEFLNNKIFKVKAIIEESRTTYDNYQNVVLDMI